MRIYRGAAMQGGSFIAAVEYELIRWMEALIFFGLRHGLHHRGWPVLVVSRLQTGRARSAVSLESKDDVTWEKST